jgi:hypothetical protein
MLMQTNIYTFHFIDYVYFLKLSAVTPLMNHILKKVHLM